MLMATPEMTWLTLNVTVATAWMRPPSMPPSDAEQKPDPRPALPRADATEPGAEDHHALDADVDDADPFGPQPGQAGRRIGGAETAVSRRPCPRR